VTELVARPLISLLHPQLQDLVQPLAGEWAVRRSLFASLSVPTGYAVELAALVDTAAGHGAVAIAQVDLGTRAHGHQPLLDLGGMATQILAATLARAGSALSTVSTGSGSAMLRQFLKGPVPLDRVVETVERPPAEDHL
jgi:glucosyl-3-phosphoglycerate synthase